jgi:hypothetical protein
MATCQFVNADASGEWRRECQCQQCRNEKHQREAQVEAMRRNMFRAVPR